MGKVHLLRRWAIFNTVGAMGVVVQLAVLALLVRWGGMNYLAATAIAVEATLLHNFAWHQRWSWRDRPVSAARDVAARLGRFHLTNGAVSFVGNMAVTATLTGILGLDPVLANVAAIASCSLVNFTLSTTLVFRAAGVVLVMMAPGAAAPAAAEPGGDALKVWDTYAASVSARHSAAADGVTPFFAQDALPGSAGWRTTVLDGGVTARSVSPPDVPGGKIHHWVGAVLIPGVTLEQLLGRLQAQAGMEDRLYEDVVTSKLLARDGNRIRIFMKLRRASVLTVTYNTEHEVEYRRIGALRGSSRSIATRIAELADAGTPAEREKAPGSDFGFLWRLNAYWRYEETDRGVLIECESVTLSRSVPALARPIVSPIVSRVARESLVRTLAAVRAAVSTPVKVRASGYAVAPLNRFRSPAPDANAV